MGILYECSNENPPYDNAQIKEDFRELYEAMYRKSLGEMDRIIYPICKRCWDHKESGFIEGVQIGILCQEELKVT